jgi:hypothetical protein
MRTRESTLTPDKVKLLFSFLLSYPLAGLLKRVPDASPAKKNLFSIWYGASRAMALPWSRGHR